ncbi:SET domain-containing protein [Pilatotrama ljubarskyi]|nr:SET domain-containing protein [Pilatotrama ljubarskyi]
MIPPIPATPAPLHIRTDPHAGRKYHASTALPENTDLLGKYTPYSYTIWKRFRNEVCAECWRYDGGRRSFLTRRDDEGCDGPSTSGATHQRSSTSAALWFCDAKCQSEWIAREGIQAVDLLRQLEAARQKKAKPKPNPGAVAQKDAADIEITQEAIERAWEAVREKERSPKEVRRWRDLQLEDYEADMARYVLLALHRCHRERCNRGRASYQAAASQSEGSTAMKASDNEPSEWQTFASLQINELQLLKACPQILEHQTRIYRLIKGRFGSRATASSAASSRSSSVSAPSPNGAQPRVDNAGAREDSRSQDSASPSSSPSRHGGEVHLADLVTIANVRTILGVDPGNSFGIWEVPLTEESECLGFAVYPLASFFNHHCAPNVGKERDGRALRLLTTRAVEAGEELCISYGHVDEMDWKTRRQELLEGWYFECRCSRCTREAGEGSRT